LTGIGCFPNLCLGGRDSLVKMVGALAINLKGTTTRFQNLVLMA